MLGARVGDRSRDVHLPDGLTNPSYSQSTYSILHNFGDTGDGFQPYYGGPALSGSTLYGMTQGGGGHEWQWRALQDQHGRERIPETAHLQKPCPRWGWDRSARLPHPLGVHPLRVYCLRRQPLHPSRGHGFQDQHRWKPGTRSFTVLAVGLTISAILTAPRSSRGPSSTA